MACPFFQPTVPVDSPKYRGARLPLVREHEGFCHACEPVLPVPAERRFECCNRGYPNFECPCFPSAESIHSRRFAVRAHDQQTLRILCIEERDHTPVTWFEAQFDLASGCVAGEFSVLVRAQIEAFGRSYLILGVPR